MARASRNAPLLLLGAVLAGGAVMTLALTWDMTFFQDTWAMLIERRDFTADAILQPHNEHIAAIQVLIEWAFLKVFGMSTAKPEYVLLALGLVGTALLVFVYVRRRVGDWLALFAVVVVLTLGPAWEVLLWPFQVGYIGSFFFGLATLLALEREDRRGDIAATVFLTISLGFSSLGLPFVPGVAVAILLGARDSLRRRAYVVVVPALLFAAWYLGWGHEAESHLSLRNVFASPRFVAEAAAVSLGSMVGLGANPVGGSSDPIWGRSLLVALVVVLAIRQLGRPNIPRVLWPIATVAATNWFLTAFNYFPAREPVASRYQYAGVILILLVLASLFKGVRPSRGALAVLGAATLLAAGPNLVVLYDGAKRLDRESVYVRANTAAIEIARRTVDPDFQLTPEVAGTPSLINIYAGKYLEAVEEYGSPAYSEAELLDAPAEGRRQADIVLARALRLSSVTTLGAYRPGGGDACVGLPEAGEKRPVPLRPGRTEIEVAPGPEATFALGRFAEAEFPVSLEGGPGGSVTTMVIPPDASPRPWRLQVAAEQPVRVCSGAATSGT